MQVGKLTLRAHILAKSNELRSLEAIASDLQDSRVEVRVEVVGRSGKPSLVVVKKQKATLSDDVPFNFDDVRLVVDANGEYRLFVYHFELVRRGTINVKQPEQLRNAINEVIKNRPCPGVDIKITGQQDYLSSEVEEQTLPQHRVVKKLRAIDKKMPKLKVEGSADAVTKQNRNSRNAQTKRSFCPGRRKE